MGFSSCFCCVCLLFCGGFVKKGPTKSQSRQAVGP